MTPAAIIINIYKPICVRLFLLWSFYLFEVNEFDCNDIQI